MKNFITFLFLILISFKSFSGVEGRRSELIKVLNAQLKEIARLNKRSRGRNADLMLQMAELLLEKARLIRDKENKEFLVLSIKQRRRIKKKYFFKKSTKYFLQAQRTCLTILKRFPGYSKKNEVYYILAYNAKEFRKFKTAQKYFNYSIKTSHHKQSRKTYIALAEMYFNQKKYSKAESFYEKGLSRKNRWWTKDGYNYAWSMFKNGKRNKAIGVMREVYKKSFLNRYIDMKQSSKRELAYMYVESGRVRDAISFFKEIKKDISTNFYRMAKLLKNRGRFTIASRLLSESLKYTKDKKLFIKIKIEQLSLFERYSNQSKHLKTCQSLLVSFKKSELSKNQKSIFLYHIKKMSSLLQKQIASKIYRNEPRILKKKASLASSYLELLTEVDRKNKYKTLFYAAETLYGAKLFDKSIYKYEIAFNEAKRVGSRKFARYSLKGLLAALGEKSVTKRTRDKYLIYSYVLILDNSHNVKKRLLIYQRLFRAYLKKNKINLAEKLVLKFHKEFKRSNSKTEAMTALLLEKFQKNGNKDKIKFWSKFVINRPKVYSLKFRKMVRSVVLTMQFENVEKLRHSGDFKSALRGYLFIYKDENSSKEAKKNASYNIAVLFYKLGNPDLTYKWLMKSLSNMSVHDIKVNTDSILLMIAMISATDYLAEALNTNLLLTKMLCGKNIKNKNLYFRNAFLLSLGLNKFIAAQRLLKNARVCKIKKSILTLSHMDFVQYLFVNKHYTMLSAELRYNFGKYTKNFPKYIFYSSKLALVYRKTAHHKEAAFFFRLSDKMYKKLLRKNIVLPLTTADIYFKGKYRILSTIATQINGLKLRFPENKFNYLLKRKMTLLSRLTDLTNKFAGFGSADLYVKSYMILINAYRSFVNEIEEFAPQKKSEGYIKSFKQSISGIIVPFRKNISKLSREVRSRIIKDDLLTDSNFYFLSGLSLKSKHMKSSLMMDRVGQR